MQCPKCGNFASDVATKCRACGWALPGASDTANVAAQAEPQVNLRLVSGDADGKRATIEIPINLEVSSSSGSQAPRLNPHTANEINAIIEKHLRTAESTGWVATHAVDAQSLLNAGELVFELKRGLLDTKAVLSHARVDVVRGESYGSIAGVTRTLVCPGGDHLAGRFDVHCRICGFYLPARPSDDGLSIRLARHWQAFEMQREEARRRAALANEPGLGVTVARAVGFGLLGLAGGVARELGKDMEDARARRNMVEATRAVRSDATMPR